MLLACVLSACSSGKKIITTVILNFETTAGIAASQDFIYDDPDGYGVIEPTIEPINLIASNFTLAVEFQNRLETPFDDITADVLDKSGEYLLVFTGSAVVGPASTNETGPLLQGYADMDASGLPLGLTNTIAATPGTGTLIITLRHMPPEEPPTKSIDTLMQVKTGGVDAIGGSTAGQVAFSVNVRRASP